jgi:hypothetical protein
VTHAGTFSTGPISQTVIYAAVPSSPTAVLVTLCRTSGVSPVQIVVDHTGIFFVEACRTFALTVTESIQVSSASAVSGTYAISLNLASPTPR